MNEQPSGGVLQFDKAEFAAPTTVRTCGLCKTTLVTTYFEAKGAMLCPACAKRLRGEGGSTFARALAYGAAAAFAGTLLWLLVIKLFHIELGLVAIVVGVLVGKAIRKGAGGAGGRKFQILAMALTYASITASYVPFVLKGIYEGAKKQHEQQSAAKDPGASEPESDDGVKGGTPASDAAPKPMAGGALALGLVQLVVVVFGYALAAPFLGGIGNIMGIFIIAIALYEAWKYTRGITIVGPFTLAAASPGPGAPPSPRE